jgi:4-hydroxybenzoate polyprenyltransferase
MTAGVATGRARPSVLRVLLGSAHLGPTLAVTVLVALLCGAQGLDAARSALVVAAVLAGQLSIGWSNDLIDLARDRSTGRHDKPLVDGSGSVRTVRVACGLAVAATVALSLAVGVVAGLVHLACVACGWAYNLGLKSTVWSWLPYALAFGGLTVFVSLAGDARAPWWWPVGAGLLGVGAHLVNVLPDVEDDLATGVRGLPHRLGPHRIAPVAAAVLALASVVVLVGASPPLAAASAVGLGVVALVALVVVGRGRTPFVAAIGIALIDAVLLVVVR